MCVWVYVCVYIDYAHIDTVAVAVAVRGCRVVLQYTYMCASVCMLIYIIYRLLLLLLLLR